MKIKITNLLEDTSYVAKCIDDCIDATDRALFKAAVKSGKTYGSGCIVAEPVEAPARRTFNRVETVNLCVGELRACGPCTLEDLRWELRVQAGYSLDIALSAAVWFVRWAKAGGIIERYGDELPAAWNLAAGLRIWD
jgi:hypothetical protein